MTKSSAMRPSSCARKRKILPLNRVEELHRRSSSKFEVSKEVNPPCIRRRVGPHYVATNKV